MGNSSQNRTNQLLDKQRQQNQGLYSPIINEAGNRSNAAYQDAQSQIPGLKSGYQGFADTGGIDTSGIDFGGGGGGGIQDIDPSQFGDAIKGYQDFAAGGGGIPAVDAEGIRARQNRIIPSFYKSMEEESGRRRLVNPYSPSFDAETASRARQAGQQSAETARDTETQISQLVADQAGKNAQFRLQGLGGLSSLETNIADMRQRGQIASGQLNESAAARRQAGQIDVAKTKQSGRLAGLGGLQGLYDTANSNAAGYQNTQLSGAGGLSGGNTNAINSRQNTTPWWKTLLGAASGPATSYFANR